TDPPPPHPPCPPHALPTAPPARREHRCCAPSPRPDAAPDEADPATAGTRGTTRAAPPRLGRRNLMTLSLRRPTSALPALLALVRSEEHTSELQSRENLVCR